jgi:type III restriction enzyme
MSTRVVEPNRFGPFDRAAAYSNWSRSQHPLQWFDTAPERTLANLLDAATEVEVWSRIQRGELTVDWGNGRYSPDFYAQVGATHYLLEVKADRDITRPEVQGKASAAKEWARHVTYEGDYGTWQYLLVSETDLGTAKTVAALISQASSRS